LIYNFIKTPPYFSLGASCAHPPAGIGIEATKCGPV